MVGPPCAPKQPVGASDIGNYRFQLLLTAQVILVGKR